MPNLMTDQIIVKLLFNVLQTFSIAGPATSAAVAVGGTVASATGNVNIVP